MEKIEVTKGMLKKLMDATISDQEVLRLQNSYKDEDRFDKYLELLQESVPWDDKIMMRLSEHVFVVQTKSGDMISKCTCGQEFGDYRINWKMNCLVNVRRSKEEMGEVYAPEPAIPEPGWAEIREFYCPKCAAQLAVEVVPPGYPVIFEMLPDIPGFYRETLGRPLSSEEKYCYEDKTLSLTQKWGKEV